MNGDLSTLKIAVLFRHQLSHAVSTGRLHYPLFEFLKTLFLCWPTDTQEIEGVNSIISRMVSLAPAIQLPLLSARITVKKALGTLRSKTKADTHTARNEFIKDSCQTHAFANMTLNEMSTEMRFAIPVPADYPPCSSSRVTEVHISCNG